ncbi:MAG: hypothetical protein QM747_04460 [Nocardioides sp.]
MTHDDQLRRLLSDAVSDIEPADRIDHLRASVRPSPKVVPMARHRSWYAVTGIVATAAVIGVIAYLTSVAGNKSNELGPAGQGTALPTATAIDPSSGRSIDSAKPSMTDLPLYYVGHSPRGAVLYRQDTPVSAALPPLQTAVNRLTAMPFDSDYRLGWSPGWLTSAAVRDGVIQVNLGGVPTSRPDHMTARTAYLVVQSAVYTFQGASGSHAPVMFMRGGLPVPTVLGVATGHPLVPGRAGDVLSRVDITAPAVDQMRPGGGRLVVAGTDAEPLSRVLVRLVGSGSVGTVRSKAALSGGVADENGRYHWRLVLDTTSLSRGTYTVSARNDGRHGDVDTRTVVVR